MQHWSNIPETGTTDRMCFIIFYTSSLLSHKYHRKLVGSQRRLWERLGLEVCECWQDRGQDKGHDARTTEERRGRDGGETGGETGGRDGGETGRRRLICVFTTSHSQHIYISVIFDSNLMLTLYMNVVLEAMRCSRKNTKLYRTWK